MSPSPDSPVAGECVCWGCSWLVWPPHHHHPPASIDHRPVARQPRSSVQQLVTMAVMEAASILLLLSLVSASAGGLVSHSDMVAPSLSPSPCWQCILVLLHLHVSHKNLLSLTSSFKDVCYPKPNFLHVKVGGETVFKRLLTNNSVLIDSTFIHTFNNIKKAPFPNIVLWILMYIQEDYLV